MVIHWRGHDAFLQIPAHGYALHLLQMPRSTAVLPLSPVQESSGWSVLLPGIAA